MSASAPQTLPSTRPGGQDDVSSNKLPQNISRRGDISRVCEYMENTGGGRNIFLDVRVSGRYFNKNMIKYGVPEAREASKNIPGARGFVFPKYQPVAIHGDPIHPQNNLEFRIVVRTCTSQTTHFPKLDLNSSAHGPPSNFLDPSQRVHIECLHLLRGVCLLNLSSQIDLSG